MGHDTVTNRIVKKSKWLIWSALASICNNSIETGKFPKFWKHGVLNAYQGPPVRQAPSSHSLVTEII